MTGEELLVELMGYGVSSICLSTTGSLQKGVRACTSRMREELYPVLRGADEGICTTTTPDNGCHQPSISPTES
jgi:hypothetical protein